MRFKTDIFLKKISESQNNPDYDWHDNLVHLTNENYFLKFNLMGEEIMDYYFIML